DSLKPNYGGGRPPTFTAEQREAIIDLAQIPPHTIGYPFTNWSLSKLKEAAEERGIVPSISIETVRVILDEAQITYQHTKTWKESTDPEFEVKKKRIESLYEAPPTDGRVICVDEFGPLSLQPYRGKGWFQQRRP
ncbi:helix-turn-helix domain-containing protein, partial [Paenibacillus elgii]|uniref:helix-turn-helix domain-containing protein n=1 Tax=Paenibacillus elgii TaxID=189691 RepID=UPI0030DBDD05